MPVQELSRWPDGTKLRVGGDHCPAASADGAGRGVHRVGGRGGVVNVVLYPEVFAAYREGLRSRFVVIEGTLQWQGRVCGVAGEWALAVEGCGV